MPDWLVEIEEEIVAMLVKPNFMQREQIERLLLAYWHLSRVDELIDAATQRMFEPVMPKLSDPGSIGARVIPVFLLRDSEAELCELAKLHSYRRRFRGHRDRCLARLFRDRLPPAFGHLDVNFWYRPEPVVYFSIGKCRVQPKAADLVRRSGPSATLLNCRHLTRRALIPEAAVADWRSTYFSNDGSWIATTEHPPSPPSTP